MDHPEMPGGIRILLFLGISTLILVICVGISVVTLDAACASQTMIDEMAYPGAEIVDTTTSSFIRIGGIGATRKTYRTAHPFDRVITWMTDSTGQPPAALRTNQLVTRAWWIAPDDSGQLNIETLTECGQF